MHGWVVNKKEEKEERYGVWIFRKMSGQHPASSHIPHHPPPEQQLDIYLQGISSEQPLTPIIPSVYISHVLIQ